MNLDDDGALTNFDYEFLKGNLTVWPCWGAAYGVVSEWCRKHGYGDFGLPTRKGTKAMMRFLEDI